MPAEENFLQKTDVERAFMVAAYDYARECDRVFAGVGDARPHWARCVSAAMAFLLSEGWTPPKVPG